MAQTPLDFLLRQALYADAQSDPACKQTGEQTVRLSFTGADDVTVGKLRKGLVSALAHSSLPRPGPEDERKWLLEAWAPTLKKWYRVDSDKDLGFVSEKSVVRFISPQQRHAMKAAKVAISVGSKRATKRAKVYALPPAGADILREAHVLSSNAKSHDPAADFSRDDAPTSQQSRSSAADAAAFEGANAAGKKPQRRAWATKYDSVRRLRVDGFDRAEDDIPPIVTECLDYLQDYVEAQGLFRLSGRHEQVQQLKKLYMNGAKNVDLSKVDDPNTVAGVLKLWLRELSSPLTTFELYEMWKEAIHQPTQLAQVIALRKVVKRLPPGNQAILTELFAFLQKLHGNRETTLMDDKNLAIVFSPTLFRTPISPDNPLGINLEEGKATSQIVKMLVLEYHSIFTDEVSDADRHAGSIDQFSAHFVQRLKRASMKLHRSLEREADGKAPLNPLELAFEDSDVETFENISQPASSLKKGDRAVAIWAYQSQGFEMTSGDKDLSLPEGSKVQILEILPNDWVRVSFVFDVGVVPVAFLAPVE